MIEDITFCTDEQCPKRLNCLRFTMKPKALASYFAESPYDKAKEDCDYYVEERGGKEKK